MTTSPLANISFVIPSYNASSTIVRAIHSVLDQKSVTTKVIVVDHGSSDGTGEVVRTLFDGVDSVMLFEIPRETSEIKSASRPLNYGIRKLLQEKITPSTWIARLDADDCLISSKAIAEVVERGGNVDIITSLLVFYNPQSQTASLYGPQPQFRTLKKMLTGGAYAMAHHTTLIRASFLEKLRPTNLHNELLSYGEDLDFSMRLLKSVASDKITFVDTPLMLKYRGLDTLTETTSSKKIWQDHLCIFRDHPELSRVLLWRMKIDLSLRREQTLFRFFRKIFGFPGLRVGFELPFDYNVVLQRLEELPKYERPD